MKLITDNRDPKKLDLTVATKNEENRIVLLNIMNHSILSY